MARHRVALLVWQMIIRLYLQHTRTPSIYIYMDVSALLRLKQRASRMAPSEFSFTATSQLTDPTIYLCSGSKPCSESTPCKRTTLFMIFLPPSCFLGLLPPSCFLRPPLRITMTHNAKHTSARIHMHPSISFWFLLHCGCCCPSCDAVML